MNIVFHPNSFFLKTWVRGHAAPRVLCDRTHTHIHSLHRNRCCVLLYLAVRLCLGRPALHSF